MKYLVIVDGSDARYSAYSPDLPGCVARGETREETLALMHDAIALHLEGPRRESALKATARWSPALP